MMLPDRIEAKIDRNGPGGCWLWTAAKAGRGYGVVTWDGRQQYAHRVIYELLIGQIPEGLTIDHVWERGCTHTNCVNPDHLEPVSHWENNSRGNSATARNWRREHCHQGHPLDGTLDNGHRYCTTCAGGVVTGDRSKIHYRGICAFCGAQTSGRHRTRCVDCYRAQQRSSRARERAGNVIPLGAYRPEPPRGAA